MCSFLPSLLFSILYLSCQGDQFKESMDTLNKYSESPIHVAIRLSQDKVLSLLIEKGADDRLLCGHMYAIHLALKHNSFGCVTILIKHRKDCINDKDLKYDSAPLHWAKTSKVSLNIHFNDKAKYCSEAKAFKESVTRQNNGNN